MRYLFVTPNGVIDTLTGELSPRVSIEQLLTERPGGVIAGRNLYPVLAPMMADMRSDVGWTAAIVTQKKRQRADKVGGVIYFSNLYYRHPKEQVEEWVDTPYGRVLRKVKENRNDRTRYRPNSIKWLVLNLELFSESDDIQGAARALVSLAERRGITPRHSPGSFGGALLRASPEWERGRTAAPCFISEIARARLPGNFYRLRHDFTVVPHAYYLDQKSSHHTIASSIDLPHPRLLRARGRLRAVEKGKFPEWIKGENLSLLERHTGLLNCTIECDTIPHQLAHLYPPWVKKGISNVWIWTPDLRLLDRRVRLLWVSAALTSFQPDPVLKEYGNWSLDLLQYDSHPAIKPALLAAYGMLGVRSDKAIEKYSVHGRTKPPRAEECKLPLIDQVYRSTIERRTTPVLQNVVCRGVIESETRARSIEFARYLEGEGNPVVQIYADGIITVCDQLPFLPPEWRVAGELTHVTSRNPNQILSREIVRLPGIPNGRRTSILRTDREARDAAIEHASRLAR